jgi:eukaryotic-like serine/threonine-protein kinase
MRNIFIVLLMPVFACTLMAQPDSRNNSAVMFRSEANHSGVFQTEEVKTFGGLQWRFQTNGTVNSSPVIFGKALYIGSSDGFVYVLDAVSGVEKWRFNANSPINSAPAVQNNNVYITTRDGRLLAINISTQKLLWEFKSGAEIPFAWGHESGDFYISSPTVFDNKIFFGGGDGFLYAVNAESGRELWKFKTKGRIRSTPAVNKNIVYVGSFDGDLYAIDAVSGQLKWRFETEGSHLNSAEFGFDRKSIQSSPAVTADNKVIFGSRDGFIYAVDAMTGKELWRVDHDSSWINSSPACVGGFVYAGTSDGKFVEAINTQDGKVAWRLNTDGIVWSSPAIAGNYLYVSDGAGVVYTVDRKTGKELWRYRVQRRVFSSPLVDNGRLYFGSDDGGLYALNSSDSEPLKRAVFWDADYVKGANFRSHEALRDFLKSSDFEVLDTQKTTEFFHQRIKDHVASVVVFAIDHLPKQLSGTNGEVALMRSYLESGGKVVWVGAPPLIWERDLKTGQREYAMVNREATEKLLGIDHQASNFDPYNCKVTGDGTKWGLSGWWLCNWSVDPKKVTTVLMISEQGLASAWVKGYGGAPGTGFVRIPINETGNGTPLNLVEIKTVAEYMPK